MHAALDTLSAVTGGRTPVVLCGTDGRTRHQDVVELAADLAGDLAATVLVLHVRRTFPLAGVDLAVAGLALMLEATEATLAACLLVVAGLVLLVLDRFETVSRLSWLDGAMGASAANPLWSK